MQNNAQLQPLLKIIGDQKLRRNVVRVSHPAFFSIYFPHYITHSAAPMHREIFNITEDVQNKFAVIVAFRGSAKSTLVGLSYPIWSIVGAQQKKFVVLLGRTQTQARQALWNIRSELVSNDLLRKDLGPFKDEQEAWNVGALFISRYNARIVAVSMDQSIRGIRHRQHRPDLIIADDLEDIGSVKTQESRDAIYNWFKSDAILLGDTGTKIIVIGNLLHEDSLIMRLKQEIQSGELHGIFRSYPLIK